MVVPAFALLKKFIAGEHLTAQELKQLRDWMVRPENMVRLDEWMQELWMQAPELESEVHFEEIIAQVNSQYQSRREEKGFWELPVVKHFQRAAAILILPVILVSAYYFLHVTDTTDQYTEAIVPNGQKSEIVLPDGTHIWLNSGTRLRYPSKYGSGNRDVFLEGEAYFEVTPNKHAPFVVNTSNVAVNVLGTKFNVKAYPDETDVETALLSGKINLLLKPGSGKNQLIEMKPGEKVNYNLQQKITATNGFETDEIVGWKNNRLVFRDDTFDKLVKKIERWYDVEVLYDEMLLDSQRLTVELNEGESIDRLMEIIDKVMHVESQIVNRKVMIKPKMKS
ncbi:FecR family protein [Gaoshiqia sediminis]|uniref:FecR domain-containing protein n=1 Tax=Gaoshiqia sediminis TaxID=2986998 RepID=A0AA42C9A0_9BACT|nr:FecR domain-containing protein [Gaoshiqia sediminis]MCW0481865.1 FecR domain-containing protein [Gaoshiqia sediminis]